MSLESELLAQINNLQQSYENKKRENALLERQIRQLEEMRGHVRAARNRVDSARDAMKRISVAESWKGRARTRFDNKRTSGDVHASADKLYDRIDNLDGEIGNKIWDLRLQVDYGVKILSSCEDGINDLKRQFNDLADGD